jgi:hypothetical protein
MYVNLLNAYFCRKLVNSISIPLKKKLDYHSDLKQIYINFECFDSKGSFTLSLPKNKALIATIHTHDELVGLQSELSKTKNSPKKSPGFRMACR